MAGGGKLFIGVTSDQQWDRFVEEFGLQKLAADPRLANNVLRVKERSWLIPALREVIIKVPTDEAAARCLRANVSWAPVGQPKDLFEDAHLQASGGLLDVVLSHAGGGQGRSAGLPAMPMELGDQRKKPQLRLQPPAVGEHNAAVLGEAGLSIAEIKDLADRGAIVSL